MMDQKTDSTGWFLESLRACFSPQREVRSISGAGCCEGTVIEMCPIASPCGLARAAQPHKPDLHLSYLGVEAQRELPMKSYSLGHMQGRQRCVGCQRIPKDFPNLVQGM